MKRHSLTSALTAAALSIRAIGIRGISIRAISIGVASVGVVSIGAATLCAAQSLYVTPDVPTTETVGGTTLSPDTIYRYAPPGTYTPVLTVPGSPRVGGVHKQDRYGAWLLTVEEPSDLGGALGGGFATPRDVIRYDGAVYSVFLCGAAIGIPEGSKIDALYQVAGDLSGLILSFDVPTEIPPMMYNPADLVFFGRSRVTCADWLPGGIVPSGAIPLSTNTLDADFIPGSTLLSLDVPTNLGGIDYVPGQIVSFSGGVFALYATLGGWPGTSLVAGLSGLANPGEVPWTLMVAKSTMTPGALTLTWSSSCSEGGENYGIYEGTLGMWYSHTAIDCSDGAPALTEDIMPAMGSTYYLVVPHNGLEEGSYGRNSAAVQRPVGAATCASPQVVTLCPPP